MKLARTRNMLKKDRFLLFDERSGGQRFDSYDCFFTAADCFFPMLVASANSAQTRTLPFLRNLHRFARCSYLYNYKYFVLVRNV